MVLGTVHAILGASVDFHQGSYADKSNLQILVCAVKKQMLATSLLYIVVVNLGLSSLKCDLHSVFSLWQFCFEHLQAF